MCVTSHELCTQFSLWSYVVVEFAHILQGCFSGTEAIVCNHTIASVVVKQYRKIWVNILWIRRNDRARPNKTVFHGTLYISFSKYHGNGCYHFRLPFHHVVLHLISRRPRVVITCIWQLQSVDRQHCCGYVRSNILLLCKFLFEICIWSMTFWVIKWINSLRPSDAIWRHRSGST